MIFTQSLDFIQDFSILYYYNYNTFRALLLEVVIYFGYIFYIYIVH
jgi:hypothetical protein